jgi:hypothetical protein
MEPSKLKQHTARRIQSALGPKMPASAGLCNAGCTADAAVREGWKVVNGRCACGGSCAAGRASLGLPDHVPLISFGRRGVSSTFYDQWISWAKQQLEQHGLDWLEGRVQAAISSYEQAVALHHTALAARREVSCRCRLV